MTSDMKQLYNQRLDRYVTTMRNEKADMIPIRPFAAEFTARYAGFNCQQVTHDYENAFTAVRKCAKDFDWDAVVSNMVYVWTGLTQAMGLKYYAAPGLDIGPDTGFQYREPSETEAFMQPNEYDQLIEDPTGFLFNVWLPRVSNDVSASGEPTSYRNNLSFLKGGMAMMKYFNSFGTQNALLESETGTVPAIAGIFKAPLDLIADKLRGYIGLTMDIFERPQKVLAACEALMPHLLRIGLTSADPNKNVPIAFWMHRGCVPFVSHDTFNNMYWPTLKPIVEEFWPNGHQTLFYAEGNWDAHLNSFAELADGSIVYHVDRGDIFKVHKEIGHKFCLSGGIPNYLLGFGTPDEVREYCKKVIDGVAGDGGYIMDASAIIQNDAKIENIKAMTDFTRDYGVYSASSSAEKAQKTVIPPPSANSSDIGPGICIPWEQKLKEIPPIQGDKKLAKNVWQDIDSLAYMYIWHCIIGF